MHAEKLILFRSYKTESVLYNYVTAFHCHFMRKEMKTNNKSQCTVLFLFFYFFLSQFAVRPGVGSCSEVRSSTGQ